MVERNGVVVCVRDVDVDVPSYVGVDVDCPRFGELHLAGGRHDFRNGAGVEDGRVGADILVPTSA